MDVPNSISEWMEEDKKNIIEDSIHGEDQLEHFLEVHDCPI